MRFAWTAALTLLAACASVPEYARLATPEQMQCVVKLRMTDRGFTESSPPPRVYAHMAEDGDHFDVVLGRLIGYRTYEGCAQFDKLSVLGQAAAREKGYVNGELVKLKLVVGKSTNVAEPLPQTSFWRNPPAPGPAPASPPAPANPPTNPG